MSEKSNNINLELYKEQEGNIKVHTQIINDLSSGIYSSPASCVKELVNNSYDADAKNVVIRVKPLNDIITIIDDGNGMNAVDFDQKFAWISHSTKRKDSQLSAKLKRPLIGKIGIGFIAVNEICDELEIMSSKEGEGFKFTARINFKNYFEKSNGDSNVDDGIIKGEYNLINEEEEEEEHYTIIKLIGLKESVLDILSGKQYLSSLLKEKNSKYDENIFNSMVDLMHFHSKRKLKSFSEDNQYIQFVLDLASYIPVEYIEGGPILNYHDEIIDEIVNEHEVLDFKVDLDGIYLKKPIYFEPKGDLFDVSSFKKSIKTKGNDEIILKGYFYVNNQILYPRELNGVAVRIRKIPIAEQYGYDDSFMKYPNYTNQLFRNWISGEIFIEKGLEDAMNIDRKSFRITHPHYLTLQNFLHKYLSETVFKKTLNLYEKSKSTRDNKKQEEKKRDDQEILETKKIDYRAAPKNRSKKLKQAGSAFPLKILKSSKSKAIVEVNHTLANKFKKKDWEYLESIFLIFESAYTESKGDAEELRKIFYKKINHWKNIYE